MIGSRVRWVDPGQPKKKHPNKVSILLNLFTSSLEVPGLPIGNHSQIHKPQMEPEGRDDPPDQGQPLKFLNLYKFFY